MFGDCTHVPRGAEPVPAHHGEMPYMVAVVSDGSALTDQDPISRAGSVEPALRHWAALIGERTGPVTRPVYVAAQDAEDLGAGLRGLAPDIGAIVLIAPTRPLLSPGALADRPAAAIRSESILAVLPWAIS